MIVDKEIKLLPQKVPHLVEKILKKLKNSGIKEDILFDLKLALNEALINAIKHGNNLDQHKSVFLKIVKKDNKLEICIQDQGKGFDYTNLKSPTDDENLIKYSGRGIFLIKNFMDELDFSDGGCKLKMIKYLNKGD